MSPRDTGRAGAGSPWSATGRDPRGRRRKGRVPPGPSRPHGGPPRRSGHAHREPRGRDQARLPPGPPAAQPHCTGEEAEPGRRPGRALGRRPDAVCGGRRETRRPRASVSVQLPAPAPTPVLGERPQTSGRAWPWTARFHTAEFTLCARTGRQGARPPGPSVPGVGQGTGGPGLQTVPRWLLPSLRPRPSGGKQKTKTPPGRRGASTWHHCPQALVHAPGPRGSFRLKGKGETGSGLETWPRASEDRGPESQLPPVNAPTPVGDAGPRRQGWAGRSAPPDRAEPARPSPRRPAT